jgi:hypothetical protein
MLKRSFHRDAVFVMALYNIVVGAAFFFLYERVFQLFGIETYTPAHPPAIQIPCLFLVIFGLGYLWASRDLARNGALLFVGLLQNAGVTALVVWYQLDQPELAHAVYWLPAWVGAAVDARRERRRAKVMPVKPLPRRVEAPAMPKPEAEPPVAAEPAGRFEQPARGPIEEIPEPCEPETPTEPSLPEGAPPPRSQAHDTHSGTPNDEPPATASA